MSNCRRDKGSLTVTVGELRASPLLTARDNAETMAELCRGGSSPEEL